MLKITVESNIAAQSSKVKKEILRRRGELLNVLGVQLLSNVLLAYNDKARGMTGDDGVRWKPLKESTIKAKQRRGKKNKRKSRHRRGNVAGPSGSTSTMIGVDTGLQRASASPGFRGGSQGGNILKVEEQAAEVTVGFGRTYSKYFDDDRPLFPNDLPAEWENELDDIVQGHYEEILGELEA